MSIFYRDKEMPVAVVMVRAFHDRSISEDRYMLGIVSTEKPMMNMLMRLMG